MKHTPLTPKFPQMLHGGDYNPEQWKDYPEILERDIELMKEAHINCVSLGIFSWADIEPEEDLFNLEWLDNTIERLWKAGIHVILATPSGARPHWLADKYQEVLRVAEDGTRNFFGGRENHCYTSPVYRERVKIIDELLAEHYANHPAVIAWHISNEFNGECHCELCKKAFREFLQDKYGSLEQLNHDWWAHFWSHTYTNWEQVQPPSSKGEDSIQGLVLDWKRFVTKQTIDFMKSEIETVKSANSEIPVTTNFMGMYFDGLDYFQMAKELDIIAWDSYPMWHAPWGNIAVAQCESLSHDMMRSLKKSPFLLMECTPSTTNWHSVSKQKRPGMHVLSIVNAVAHGADSSMYFQIRQSRGSAEKFHSAVISHAGTNNTRTFKEVTEVGELLQKLTHFVYGTDSPAEVAIVFDVQNKWAIDASKGPRNDGIDYFGEIQRVYHYFWKNGITTDIVDETADFSGYKLVIAPMLYMFRDDIQKKFREFVSAGGTLVTTVFSGVVNQNDLCFLGEDTEEKLSDVMGMWVEEIDGLYDGDKNRTSWYIDRTRLFYDMTQLCEVIRPTTCDVVATFEKDYYKGCPAITKNAFGEGFAWHVAGCAPEALFDELFRQLDEKLQLERAMDAEIPNGVSVTWRQSDDGRKIVFVQNFSDCDALIPLKASYTDMVTGNKFGEALPVEKQKFRILLENPPKNDE